MKVRLQIEDIMSPEEEDRADEIRDFIDDILGVRPVGTYSEYENFEYEE